MYIPGHFSQSSLETLYDLIVKNPLGMLVTNGKAGLDANHIPFELDAQAGPHGTLRAHVARANPLWTDVQNGDEVLAVFRGADAYISPNWFPSKHEFHKQVPTWNYMVAHVHGKITIHDEERYVRGVVARLVRHHEATQQIPWKMTDSPSEYIDMMLKSIVGIEIEISRVDGKFKLSQNREPRDIRGAGDALKNQGDTVIGEAMLNCIPKN
jgi:transcriptional regulator